MAVLGAFLVGIAAGFLIGVIVKDYFPEYFE